MASEPEGAPAEQADASFEALLDFLRRTRGIDLTGYKRTSLERRFKRRLDAVGGTSWSDYLDHLEVHPDEYEQLFDTLLVNVTRFFRDEPAWRYLKDDALPAAFADKPSDEPIRVWSAGCATGQEAFTIAVVLAELLGADEYRDRVKIYATDIDETAIGAARLALYTAKELESMPADLRERYFERIDGRMGFRKDLRETVIFGRNDLLRDTPISRLDLLVCRNTLMYFNAETQSRILRHFHFALREQGVLMLGKSETMLAHRDLFTALDLEKRVFCRRPRRVPLPDHAASLGDRQAALETGPLPHLIVARSGELTFANLAARALFHIELDDIGRPFRDLDVSYRPAELRQPVDEALQGRRRVAVGEVTFTPERGEERRLEIAVLPLLGQDGTAIAVSVVFEDVTRYARLQSEIESQRQELEHAYEELRLTIDELETTNEGLRAANEELQTSNEALQTSNEELERMNEQVQSANEELAAINDELRERTAQLDQLEESFEAIFASIRVGVAVVDRGQRVQVWNRQAEDLWGLRRDEALDRQFPSLDLGLPTAPIAAALRAVIAGESRRERLELDAVDRRGRAILCATEVVPLYATDGAVRGAVILMEIEPEAGVARQARR